eukprot:g2867.t1
MSLSKARGVITLCKRVTPKVKLLRIALESDLAFLPGQWADFDVLNDQNLPLGGYSYVSPPSFASSSTVTSTGIDEKYVEFLIKKPRGAPRFAMTNWIWEAEGCFPTSLEPHQKPQANGKTIVELTTGGTFVLPVQNASMSKEKTETKDKYTETKLIAGGIGVTPYLSFLRDLHLLRRKKEEKSHGKDPLQMKDTNVSLHWSIANLEELSLLNIFSDSIYLSEIHIYCPQQTAGGLQHCQLEHTEENNINIEDYLKTSDIPLYFNNRRMNLNDVYESSASKTPATAYYLCGPESMVDFFSDRIPDAHFERWW